MSKRTYRATARAASVQETRAEILRAAVELFAEQGYRRATVAGIAQRAQVALSTVYTSVGGKPALIDALVREGVNDPAISSAQVRIRAETDARRMLRLLADGTGAVTRSRATLIRVLVDNATADPAVAAAAEYGMRRYRERLTEVARLLVTLRAVRGDAVRTEQILWFYFGFHAWDAVDRLGWNHSEGAEWLTGQAAEALLRPPAEDET